MYRRCHLGAKKKNKLKYASHRGIDEKRVLRDPLSYKCAARNALGDGWSVTGRIKLKQTTCASVVQYVAPFSWLLYRTLSACYSCTLKLRFLASASSPRAAPVDNTLAATGALVEAQLARLRVTATACLQTMCRNMAATRLTKNDTILIL